MNLSGGSPSKSLTALSPPVTITTGTPAARAALTSLKLSPTNKVRSASVPKACKHWFRPSAAGFIRSTSFRQIPLTVNQGALKVKYDSLRPGVRAHNAPVTPHGLILPFFDSLLHCTPAHGYLSLRNARQTAIHQQYAGHNQRQAQQELNRHLLSQHQVTAQYSKERHQQDEGGQYAHFILVHQPEPHHVANRSHDQTLVHESSDNREGKVHCSRPLKKDCRREQYGHREEKLIEENCLRAYVIGLDHSLDVDGSSCPEECCYYLHTVPYPIPRLQPLLPGGKYYDYSGKSQQQPHNLPAIQTLLRQKDMRSYGHPEGISVQKDYCPRSMGEDRTPIQEHEIEPEHDPNCHSMNQTSVPVKESFPAKIDPDAYHQCSHTVAKSYRMQGRKPRIGDLDGHHIKTPDRAHCNQDSGGDQGQRTIALPQ